MSPWGEGHENYNLMSPSPTDATYQICIPKIGPVVLGKKITDDGHQTIAIGHLSDSGDKMLL